MLRSVSRFPINLTASRFYTTRKTPFAINNHPQKTIDVVNQDYKLKDHTRRVFTHMSKFLGTTAISSGLTVGLGNFLINHNQQLDTLIIPVGMAWGAAAIGSFYCAYKLDTEQDFNSAKRLEYAYMMHGLMGITIAPSLILFPQFIPHALAITSGLVAGPVSIALMAPKDSFLSWGVPLNTGLFGLIGIGVSSIFFNMIGMNELAFSLHSIDLYGGVALFTAFSAYDTHKLISDFEQGKKDAVGHACHFSLNFINLFIRLLEILSKNQKK